MLLQFALRLSFLTSFVAFSGISFYVLMHITGTNWKSKSIEFSGYAILATVSLLNFIHNGHAPERLFVNSLAYMLIYLGFVLEKKSHIKLTILFLLTFLIVFDSYQRLYMMLGFMSVVFMYFAYSKNNREIMPISVFLLFRTLAQYFFSLKAVPPLSGLFFAGAYANMFSVFVTLLFLIPFFLQQMNGVKDQ